MAIGKPVAFEASADERDTRGFISITIMRPSAGLIANWMLQPPVSTPTSRSTAMPTSRMCWYSRSVSVIAGATVIESPVCTPIGSMFSIEQTTTTLSLRSRISSSSNSFQPNTDSSTSTSCTGLAARPARTIVRTSSASVARPEPRPPIVKRRPDDDLVVDRRGELDRLVERVADQRRRDLGADAAHDLLEPLAILAALDRLDVGADQLDAVPLEHSAACSATARFSAVCPPRVASSASGRSAAMTFSTNSGVSGSM